MSSKLNFTRQIERERETAANVAALTAAGPAGGFTSDCSGTGGNSSQKKT